MSAPPFEAPRAEVEPAPAPPAEDLGQRAARGARWTVLGMAGTQALRFLSNVILSHLFSPHVFASINLAATFFVGLGLFSDVGIRPSIVQSSRGDDPRFVNTAWTMQVLRGVGMWLVALPLAYPFAHFFEDPVLVPLIQVGGAAAFLMGLNSSKLFTLNRHLHVRQPVLIDLLAQLSTLFFTVGGALLYRSIWAMVAGTVAGALVKAVLSHRWLPGEPNRFTWDRESARTLFQFGRWVFLSTLLTFVVTQGDRLLFGRAIEKNLFGVYTVAANIALLPAMALGQLADSVMLPLYSRVRQSGEALQPVFRNARALLLLVAGWSVAGLIAGGPTAVRLFYPAAYHDGGWMLQILSLGVWFRVLEAVNNTAIIAHGDSRAGALARLAMLISMLPLVYGGFQVAGFAGAIFGYALSELVRYVVTTVFLYRLQLRALAQDLGLTAWLLGAAILGRASARLVEEHTPVLVEALLVAAVVTLAWSPRLLPFVRTYVLGRGTKAS